MPETRLAKVGILVGIVVGVAGLVIPFVLWRLSSNGGLPEFKGPVGSMEEIANFDKFIMEHKDERVNVSVNFPNDSAFIPADDTGLQRSFVLGDLRCEPARELCLNSYYYRLTRIPKSDFETQFAWGGEQMGHLLRGTYFIAGFGTDKGVNWRTMQAVPAGSSQAAS